MNKRARDIAEFVRYGRLIKVTASIRWPYYKPDFSKIEYLSGHVTSSDIVNPSGFSMHCDAGCARIGSRMLIAYSDVLELKGI